MFSRTVSNETGRSCLIFDCWEEITIPQLTWYGTNATIIENIIKCILFVTTLTCKAILNFALRHDLFYCIGAMPIVSLVAIRR